MLHCWLYTMPSNDSPLRSVDNITLAMTDYPTVEAQDSDKACIVTSEKPKFFMIEAKMGPNVWRPIGEVYPQIEQTLSYREWDQAKYAKTRLKALLLGPYKNQVKKRPIRILKIFKVL